MIIAWHGHGYLVGVFTMASSLGMELATEAIAADETYYQTKAWPFLSAMALAAVPTYLVGRSLNRKIAGRKLIDAETGEAVVMPHNTHSFFFIPMEWWGVILPAVGMAVAACRLAGAR